MFAVHCPQSTAKICQRIERIKWMKSVEGGFIRSVIKECSVRACPEPFCSGLVSDAVNSKIKDQNAKLQIKILEPENILFNSKL